MCEAEGTDEHGVETNWLLWTEGLGFVALWAGGPSAELQNDWTRSLDILMAPARAQPTHHLAQMHNGMSDCRAVNTCLRTKVLRVGGTS